MRQMRQAAFFNQLLATPPRQQATHSGTIEAAVFYAALPMPLTIFLRAICQHARDLVERVGGKKIVCLSLN